MKIQSKSSLDFIRLNVALKPNFGSGVINNLNTYASDFPALPIPVADLDAANEMLIKSLAAAQTGDNVAKAGLPKVEKDWDKDFRTTANYVSAVANGDTEIIQKGGFKPTKNETASPAAPEVVNDFDVLPGKAPGTLTASCRAANAKGYLYIAAQNGATVTQDGNMIVITVGSTKVFIEACTSRKLMMHNLTPKTELNVSMLAFNSAGAGPLSSSQSIVTQ